MTLRLWWLTVAVLTAVVATAVCDLVVIAGDSTGGARASAARPWSIPDVARIVPMALESPSASSPLPSPAPVLPKLAASSVSIPVQHVRAPIISYCPIIDGGLEPPSDVHQVCYWAGGATVDEADGTTVLTGHINWVGQGTGAFGNLAALHHGETVYTSDAQHAVTAWRIVHVKHRPKTLGVDPAAFVGHSGPRRLYLISCGGAFDSADLSYVDNIYVMAEPAPTIEPSAESPLPPPPPRVR